MSADPKSRATPSLNHAQQRNLHNACRHMDGLLKDIEIALDTRKTNSVFPKYIEIEPPKITSSHAIHTSLTFIEIAIEELSPKRMGGYGPLSTAGANDLEQIMTNLMATAQELHCCVLNNREPEQSAASSKITVVHERRSRRRENKAL